MIKKYGGYGVDANGDGKADPWDIEDAIYSAANYLAKNGAADGHLKDVVFAYNHSDRYVEEVLGFADRYVKGYVAVNTSIASSGGIRVILPEDALIVPLLFIGLLPRKELILAL